MAKLKPATVRDVILLYLADRRGEVSTKRLAALTAHLGSFAKLFGSTAVADITPGMVRGWTRRHPEWRSSCTKRNRMKAIIALCNFAVAEQIIAVSPLRGFRLPPETRREVLITSEMESRLLASMLPALADVFLALMLTGRRPDEIANVRQAEVVTTPEGVIWRMVRHKNRARTGRPADVFLSPAATGLTHRRMAMPGDRLFSTATGRAWTTDYIAESFKAAVARAGLPSDVTPYCCRHSYCTRALLAGVPLAVVAENVGNSPAVLLKNYSHLDRVGSASRFAFAALVVA